MARYRGFLTIALAFCVLAAAWYPAGAQTPLYQYFSQTGHSVQRDFLKFYNAAADPTTVYGYPVTEAFTGKDGLLVQYFQRARFEYHPALPDGQRVVLTDLGRKMYTPGVELSSFSQFACRSYPETNFAVCFAFLDYFDKTGGAAQFGYPISAFQYDHGVIVQYFEKARFEWQPALPEGQRVVLTDLGRLYFDRMGEDPGLLQAVSQQNNAGISQILSLQVRAFVRKATTLANDQQQIYLIVQDQRGTAVANAACMADLRWPDGTSSAGTVTTNSIGVAIAAINVINQPFGDLVYLDIHCAYNGVDGATTTSFRIWN